MSFLWAWELALGSNYLLTAFWNCVFMVNWDCATHLWAGRPQLVFPQSTQLPCQACAIDWFSISFVFSEWYVGTTEKKANKKKAVGEGNYFIQCSWLACLLVAKNIFLSPPGNKNTYINVLGHGICRSIHLTMPVWTVMDVCAVLFSWFTADSLAPIRKSREKI